MKREFFRHFYIVNVSIGMVVSGSKSRRGALGVYLQNCFHFCIRIIDRSANVCQGKCLTD